MPSEAPGHSRLPGVWRPHGPGAGQDLDWEAVAEAPGPRTALRMEGGAASFGPAHLDRLGRGLRFLGQPEDWLKEAFEAALDLAPDGLLRLRAAGALRVLLARSEALPVLSAPYRLLAAPHPLGDPRRDSRAAHKGLLGGWSAAALAQARAAGADDLLCLWPDGSLAETAIASVAVVDGDRLRLPPLPGRVASIAEVLALPAWAAARGLEPRWESIAFGETFGKQLVCFNAVRGVWQADLLTPTDP